MTKPINLSDETIEKLAEALKRKIVPLTHPTYIDLTYRPWHPHPYYGYYTPYPFATSTPNSGSVSGSSYGTRLQNG